MLSNVRDKEQSTDLKSLKESKKPFKESFTTDSVYNGDVQLINKRIIKNKNSRKYKVTTSYQFFVIKTIT